MNNQLAFIPSAAATFFVGIMLLFFFLIVAATAGLVSTPVTGHKLSWLCFALSIALLARALVSFGYRLLQASARRSPCLP